MKLLVQDFEDPEINLTSLIDVVFLLLIFFMVSTTFQRQAQLTVDLPDAASAEVAQPAGRVELVITEGGEMFLDGERLRDSNRPALRVALAAVFRERPEDILIIQADRQTPHGLVVRAMDAAAQEGITRLSIATDRDVE